MHFWFSSQNETLWVRNEKILDECADSLFEIKGTVVFLLEFRAS